MKIVYNTANNVPRVFVQSSIHEIASDDYAIFTSYDDNYLYSM